MTALELNDFFVKHNFTAAQFAEIIGVTKQAVNHWIFGRRDIPEMVVRITRMFDYDNRLIAVFKSMETR